MTPEEKRYIQKVFPPIRRIKDAGIRNKVIDAWYTVWKESGYAALEDAVMRGAVQNTLVRHTNMTTESAFALAIQFAHEYGVSVDLDVLLAAAILHDIDKSLIFEKKEGSADFSSFGKKIPHGAYGGHIALQVGLPVEVASIVMTHAKDCTWEPVSVEGIFIYYADLANYYAANMAFGWKR